MNDNSKQINQSLYATIAGIISASRTAAYRATNTILLKMYWQIGQLIVEDEQEGVARAEYGKGVLKNLAIQLTLEFGTGFDESNLRNMRNFYLAFEIWDAVRPELSWTHYRIISRIENQQLYQQIPAVSA